MRVALGLFLAAILSGCASTPSNLPYPSFVQTDDLPDVFMATLPGVRAKRYAEDQANRTGRYRVDLPQEWTGSSAGTPDAALELFVIAGELVVGDIKLIPGGYAYLPSGSLGFRLASPSGARILYFMSAEDPTGVIRSPLIMDGVEANWEETAPGQSMIVLRNDPGSGARTWLLRTTSEATPEWEISSTAREGYLVSGVQTMSECFEGNEKTGTYRPGGYFLRPENTIYGGGNTAVESETIWFLREVSAGVVTKTGACIETVAAD